LVTDAHAAQAVLELQRERSLHQVGHRDTEGQSIPREPLAEAVAKSAAS
jgi:hypothetical protein